MIATATALRRPHAVPLSRSEVSVRPVRRRVGLTWALLYLNTLTFFPGISILSIPHKIGQLVTQGSLALAVLLALTVNPKLKVRPNVFLCIVSLLLVDTLITAASPQHFGTVYRTVRLAEFVVVLWLLTPWWGRRDMLLVRWHLRCNYVMLGSVLLGLLCSPTRAIQFGRLNGVIWPSPPPQVAHYAAVAAGLTAVLWLARLVSGRAALAGVTFAVTILLLAHTRTALAGLVAGFLVAGLSLFTINSRVRTFFAAGTAAVSAGIITLGGVITTWLSRGESENELTSLTGRTAFWDLVAKLPRTGFEEIFGFGLSNASINGLSIDSNWYASYLMEGIFGVVICAVMLAWMLVIAFFQPRGVQRALALFLVIYCMLASYTEVTITDASTYLLDLALAASLLIGTARSRTKQDDRSWQRSPSRLTR